MEKVESIKIRQGSTIKQALKQMDEAGEKTLFVQDDNFKLCGTLTDGDVRRWILKGNGLTESVDKAMNTHPIFLKEGYSIEEARNIMVSKKIECLPIVDEDRKILSAIWWIDLFEGKSKKRKAVNLPVVIMAGGKGTRLGPFTNILPKPLIPVGEQPIIEMIIDRFLKYGCKKFYLSINYKANLIKAYFSDIKHDYAIDFIQEDQPLGTAGSLSLLKETIKSTFYVTNCDILIDADYADILKYHRKHRNKITLVGSMKHYTIPYGVCETSDGGSLIGMREKPEYSFLVNTGLYILEPETLNDIPESEIFHITDLINLYMKKGERVGVYPVSEKSWLDMGQLEEFHDMLKKFGIK